MMIGTGGFVVVVPHLFSVPVSVLWMGLQNYLNNYTLDVKNILAGSHTEHRWRCSLHKSKNRKVTKLL
jgi:hypothetical protein